MRRWICFRFGASLCALTGVFTSEFRRQKTPRRVSDVNKKREFTFPVSHFGLRSTSSRKMIFLVVACLAVLPHVRSTPGNETTEEVVSKSVPPAEGRSLPSTGKIYSDLIKIYEKKAEQQPYDTISYSTHQPNEGRSQPQATQPDPKIFILDNGKTYEVGQQQYQAPNPYLSSAISAVSAHLISQANEEYIPFPPNGNPQDYPAYRGHGHGESPLAAAYERANRAGYGFYPSHQDQPNFGAYQNHHPHSCLSSFYPGDTERVDFEAFPVRSRKEPIKRQILTASFG